MGISVNSPLLAEHVERKIHELQKIMLLKDMSSH